MTSLPYGRLDYRSLWQLTNPGYKGKTYSRNANQYLAQKTANWTKKKSFSVITTHNLTDTKGFLMTQVPR